MTTIFIAPASGDTHHPQARIYASEALFNGAPLNHYRNFPHLWKEVGLINYQGRLVCFDGTERQREDLIDAQPLAAGYAFFYED